MRRLALAAAAFAVACVSTSDGVIDTTLEEIAKDLWAFHDKRVRVRGAIGECRGGACSICQSAIRGVETQTRPLCMGVDFPLAEEWARRENGSNSDTFLDPRAYDFRRILDRFMRFSESTLVGRYSAHCTGVPDPITGDEFICVDRATELRVDQIDEVHVRWSAREYFGEPEEDDFRLQSMSEAERESILKEFARVQETDGWDWSDEPLKTFLFEADPAYYERVGLQAEGVVCACTLATCDASDWPAEYLHLMSSPANRYVCWRAEKRQDGWVFVVD